MTASSKFVHALLTVPALLAGSSSAAADCPTLLNHTFPRLQDAAPLLLYQSPGKVIPELNTASFCGFTGQYVGLESVYDKYKARGLVTQSPRLLAEKP
jgi:glutathione peroxidase